MVEWNKWVTQLNYMKNMGQSLPIYQLDMWLSKIDKLLNINNLLNSDINSEEIVRYYRKSEFGYWLLHSSKGSIHMALSHNNKYYVSDFYGQAKIVNEYISRVEARDILELASGKGFNSIYLSSRNPIAEFVGVDLNYHFVAHAKKKARKLKNASFLHNDFHKLSFSNNSFDIAFEVEGMCHATSMGKALSEVYRVLRPGGIFILFDGFRGKTFNSSPNNLQIASKLVEKSMAVTSNLTVDEWLGIAQQSGFEVVTVDDESQAIMPNLIRFQSLAKRYFQSNYVIQNLIKRFFPYIVQNAVSGLLMPFTILTGAQGYYCIILKRPEL